MDNFNFPMAAVINLEHDLDSSGLLPVRLLVLFSPSNWGEIVELEESLLEMQTNDVNVDVEDCILFEFDDLITETLEFCQDFYSNTNRNNNIVCL